MPIYSAARVLRYWLNGFTLNDPACSAECMHMAFRRYFAYGMGFLMLPERILLRVTVEPCSVDVLIWETGPMPDIAAESW